MLLISKKRPFSAIEGLSHRALEGLQRANLKNALLSVQTKVPRYATWNNEVFKENHEFIVKRDDFDAMLLKDARENGITIIEGKAKIVSTKKLTIKVANSTFHAKYIVDARGRFAPRNSQQKSPPTSSFLIGYKTNETQKSQTSLSTSKYGWIWQAKHENFVYFQLTSSPKNGKKHLLSLLPSTLDTNQYKIAIRDSSSYIANDLFKENYIKIGDCACAVDPLSGNGIFQALSSALLAPFAIHTLLLGSCEDKNAAIEFFTQRVEDIFNRYTTIGKYFYAKEKLYETSFWITRAKWPKEKAPKPLLKPTIKTKAILHAPFIKKHDVVVTNSSPMGVWRLGRVNLVPLVKELLVLQEDMRVNYIQQFASKNSLMDVEIEHLFHWCKENNLLSS